MFTVMQSTFIPNCLRQWNFGLSAALLMQWGIVNGNDPYLYGEKVKACLRKGARPLPGFEEYPNEEVGWGEDVIIRLH